MIATCLASCLNSKKMGDIPADSPDASYIYINSEPSPNVSPFTQPSPLLYDEGEIKLIISYYIII